MFKGSLFIIAISAIGFANVHAADCTSISGNGFPSDITDGNIANKEIKCNGR